MTQEGPVEHASDSVDNDGLCFATKTFGLDASTGSGQDVWIREWGHPNDEFKNLVCPPRKSG